MRKTLRLIGQFCIEYFITIGCFITLALFGLIFLSTLKMIFF
jgi:hypothetical protein